MKKIVITGGTGRFGEVLKKYKTKHKLFFPTKSKCWHKIGPGVYLVIVNTDF